ncbi:MAG: hypothetical protein ACP5RI_01630 [Candidatus Micrarchaeia archaeon]
MKYGPYKSYFEKVVADVLKNHNISFCYDCLSLPLDSENGKTYFYTPDFILNDVSIKGKTILVEPHGKTLFNEGIIKKYLNFMHKYNDYIYLIILTNEDKNTVKNLINYVENKGKIADEIYYIKDDNINYYKNFIESGKIDNKYNIYQKIYNIFTYLIKEKFDKNINEYL